MIPPLDPVTGILPPGLHVASWLGEWQAGVAWYEARRDPTRQSQTFDTLAEAGELLVQARLARGLTPEAVADRAGLTPEQVVAYEASAYRETPLAHCQAVAEVLGILVRVEALVPFVPGGGASAAPAMKPAHRRHA